ncbi:MAG: methyltransferase domain-containing protein [Pseudonocardia sp.]
MTPTDTVLVQFAGEFDRHVADELGLRNCTFSNLAPDSQSSRLADAHVADAHKMPYPDASFDHVIGHAGLHHCSRPHEALHEMYRLARRVVVFVENQDSWPMRLAARAGVLACYELQAVIDGGGTSGGVDGSGVPNHIYRWTRREVEKTVRSFDPGREVPITFSSEWDVGLGRVSSQTLRRKLHLRSDRVARLLLTGATRTLNRMGHRHGNIFATVVRKDLATDQAWIESGESGRLALRRTVGREDATAADEPSPRT